MTGGEDRGHLEVVVDRTVTRLGCHSNASESIVWVWGRGYTCAGVVTVEMLPGIHHPGHVDPEAVWAGQGAAEVQVGGAESSDGSVGTATEDQVLCDGQTGGLRHLETDAALGQGRGQHGWMDRWMDGWMGGWRNEVMLS